jgi:uncharacterized membrane protein YhhN
MNPGWIAALVAAVGYLAAVFVGRRGWPKVLPALLLAATSAPASPLAGAGFFLCAVGDACLLDKDRFFLHGLAAFLVGHALFVPALLARATGAPSPWLVVGVVTIASVALTLVVPRLRGLLRVAIPVYAVALGGMTVAAGAVSPVAAAGALSFVLSDGILAINRFVKPVPRADLVVMLTYYAAILLLGQVWSAG